MSILVSGGAGYIGSHTCVELLERGYEVVVVDNLYNSSEVALERVQEITGKTLKFDKGDIINREDLEPIFENEEIEKYLDTVSGTDIHLVGGVLGVVWQIRKSCLVQRSLPLNPGCWKKHVYAVEMP